MEFAKKGSGRVNKLGWKKQMKIFVTSDIHGNKALIYLIREIVKKEIDG